MFTFRIFVEDQSLSRLNVEEGDGSEVLVVDDHDFDSKDIFRMGYGSSKSTLSEKHTENLRN